MTCLSCVRWAITCAVTAALALAASGCASSSACSTCQGCVDGRLGDARAELPEGVRLPAGFHPLAGHYSTDNAADHFNGWPRYISCDRDGMVMAYVPAQTILMGGGRDLDEVPPRQVVVQHFYMDIHEVTNKQYTCFARSAGGSAGSSYQDFYKPGYNDDHPVRGVSWYSAKAYAKWACKNLPSEAQWEAAARGDDRRLYPWGNDEQSELTRFLCNARTGRDNFDGYEYTAPVQNFSAGVSPFGIYNLSGNVWEWCADWYDPGRYAYPSSEDPATGLDRGAKPFGDANYPNPIDKHVRTDRVGPLTGDERAVRGGSFADPIENCRVDVRAGLRPGATQNNVGFRTILALPASQ